MVLSPSEISRWVLCWMFARIGFKIYRKPINMWGKKKKTWFPVNVSFNQWFPVQNKAFLLLTLEWADGGAFSLKGRTRQKTRRWPFASCNATEVANVNPGFCSIPGFSAHDHHFGRALTWFMAQKMGTQKIRCAVAEPIIRIPFGRMVVISPIYRHIVVCVSVGSPGTKGNN